MSRMGPLVVGFGEILFDHLFAEVPSDVIYLGSRGGGSVSNVLVNLAHLGIRTIGMGVYGEEGPFGWLARQELESFSVDTRYLYPVRRKASRVIDELLKRGRDHQAPVHTFHGRCLVCNQKPEPSTLALTRAHDFGGLCDWTSSQALVMDKISNDRLRLVSEAKGRNAQLVAAVDIGRVDQLRYMPTAQVIMHVNSFDVAFISAAGYGSLIRRLGHDDNKLCPLFSPAGLLKVLVVTRGEGGVEVYMKDRERLDIPAPAIENVLDTAGAGDALLAYFLFNWLSYGTDQWPDRDLIVDAIRRATTRLKPVLTHEGARGHLPMPSSSSEVPTHAFRGVELEAIRNSLQSNEVCPFCYLHRANSVRADSRTSQRQKVTLKTILRDLPKRTLFAFGRKDAIEGCRKILDSGRTAYVLGTGCSFSAAEYIAQVLTTQRGYVANAMRPYDYFRGIAHLSDWLVVVSYSGATHDCGLAIERALSIGAPRIALVTHSRKPPLANLLRNIGGQGGDLVISYAAPQSQTERGFLSFAGTLIPSMLFAIAGLDEALEQTHVLGIFDSIIGKEYPNLAEIASCMRETNTADVFGGAFAWPAMVDFERKIVEGGMSGVLLHESKDFSHGRFMLVFNGRGSRTPRFLFQVGEDPYENELAGVLESGTAPFLRVKSDKRATLGGLELLIEVQFLVSKIATLLFDGKQDIAKPRDVPSDGLRLYHWQGEQRATC